jgi:hypothetical protein
LWSKIVAISEKNLDYKTNPQKLSEVYLALVLYLVE